MARLIPDSLYLTLQGVCRQMLELDKAVAPVEEASGTGYMSTSRDERLWHTPKGFTLQDMADRRSDFAYLFSKVFREVPTDCAPLPARELRDAVRRYIYTVEVRDADPTENTVRDKRADEIYTKYCLDKLGTLGYRAWSLYVATRSAAIATRDGVKYLYGVAAFDNDESATND
jgi:hypothetical protein